MASLATKRDAAEDCKFGPYTAPDCGMHLYRSVKFHFVLFSILLKGFVGGVWSVNFIHLLDLTRSSC
jgi:hypothetical protein